MRNGSCSEEPGVVCVGAVKAAPVFYLPLDQLGLSLSFVLLSTRESCENIFFSCTSEDGDTIHLFLGDLHKKIEITTWS